MAISYPITDLVGAQVITTSFKMKTGQQITRLPTGAHVGVDFVMPVWAAAYETGIMTQDECISFEAKLNSLNGVVGTFLGRDTRRLYPLKHLTGAFSDVGTIGSINVNRKALTVSGLAAGIIISVGDYLEITVGGIKFLYQAMETVTVPGGGTTAEFEVKPNLHPSAAAANAVRLQNPACLMRLEIDSVQYNPGGSALGTISFSGMQVYS